MSLLIEGYRLARHKTHGSGPAPRRQAVMLTIMRWGIARRHTYPRTVRLYWRVQPLLMRVLYVKQEPQQ